MFDLLIKNGTIVDGSGKEPFNADIALSDGKISKIAPIIKEGAGRVIDAEKQFVTPGFIDMHRHEDAFVFNSNYGEIQIRQGITTTINGNCGLSAAPLPPKYKDEILQYIKPIAGIIPQDKIFETFGDYLAIVEKEKLPINFGMLMGNGTLRMAVNGFANQLGGEEIRLAHKYIEDALQNGAFGISMGIAYMPEIFYDHKTFIKVLEPLRAQCIPITTHMRGEGNLLVEAVKEVINIAKDLQIPLHISHYKCLGKKNWGNVLKEATAQIEAAQSDGMQITVDVYPWTAGSTQLVQVLPPEFLEGGLDKTTQRLKDLQKRKECRQMLEKPQKHFENQIDLIGWENIMISSAPKNPAFVGKKITEIAEMTGKDPFEAAFDLLVEENCDVSMVNFIASPDDIETIMKYPYSAIISDSIYPASGNPHPRQYGTFALLLSDYVRDRKVLSLPIAINKITKKPADILKIKNKGVLKENYDADIAIFDLNKIENQADYINPRKLSKGFSFVIVGGEIAAENDVFLKTQSGKVIRR
ncbi:MAG: D-aminoacylase [Elusimicrobiota bacterium]|jgi:N-acyl-D-aspartate/D-glutamate deacylase|nr:D-aminoacylase [Elusimicrobiota bacterium]